jgi:hypothetical protein
MIGNPAGEKDTTLCVLVVSYYPDDHAKSRDNHKLLPMVLMILEHRMFITPVGQRSRERRTTMNLVDSIGERRRRQEEHK